MNTQEMFAKLVKHCKTQQDKIITILMARGFLIEQKEGEYYLSDNAAIEDLNYLQELLDTYKLGFVKNEEIRRYSNSQNVIVPYSAEIIIYTDASIDKVVEAFNSSKRISYEICNKQRSWHEFFYRCYGEKIPVQFLEPYVAYYVKAISACGVATNFSCDGNHENGGSIIVRSDYPYNIWHQWLGKISKSEIEALNIEKGIYFTKNNQYDLYFKLIQLANFYYRNRGILRSIKKNALSSINEKQTRNMTNDEIENLVNFKLSKEILKGRAYEWL